MTIARKLMKPALRWLNPKTSDRLKDFKMNKNTNLKPNILIVEDEPALVEMLQYNLEKAAFRTEVARDGEEALLVVSETKPDLVILDLENPWKVTKESLLYKCGWSPFENQVFKSKVISTSGSVDVNNAAWPPKQNPTTVIFDWLYCCLNQPKAEEASSRIC